MGEGEGEGRATVVDPVMREPAPDDGAKLWELVREVGLDLNSPYAYLLVSRHLAPTSVVADLDGEIVGFVSAYRPPIHNDVLFVWQVGTSPKMRGRGLARKMILHALARDACRGVRWIESTVTPDNVGSQKLFRSVARHLETDIAVSPYFTSDLFPGDQKPELLHRIGPIERRTRLEHRDDSMDMFRRWESMERSYCRRFSAVFERADGHLLFDEEGQQYLDFMSAGGAVNYGHNNRKMQGALLGYIQRQGMADGLDLHSGVKRTFLERFVDIILAPRELDYRVMFSGPSGTEAVEAAIKLARKVTGRRMVITFTGAFHGTTLGALSLGGDARRRAAAGIALSHAHHLPYDGYLGPNNDTVDLLAQMLDDSTSGIEKPAAVIVETVQVEGGVNVASFAWLRRLQEVCRANDVLLVVDDVFAGCGRTGPFFSFEAAGISPDLVTMSKSLSGYGLPLGITLIRPEIDLWKPGEHDAAFRGNNMALVTAAVALETYWRDSTLTRQVEDKGARVRAELESLAASLPFEAPVRGRGLVQGIDLGTLGPEVSKRAFDAGLMVDSVGPRESVVLIMPPLTTPDEALDRGMSILRTTVREVVSEES